LALDMPIRREKITTYEQAFRLIHVSVTGKAMFIVKDLSWIISQKKTSLTADVRIRYKHKESNATIKLLENGKAEIIFSEPQLSITPGQSAVFYRKDIVLGGGIIEEVIG